MLERLDERVGLVVVIAIDGCAHTVERGDHHGLDVAVDVAALDEHPEHIAIDEQRRGPNNGRRRQSRADLVDTAQAVCAAQLPIGRTGCVLGQHRPRRQVEDVVSHRVHVIGVDDDVELSARRNAP